MSDESRKHLYDVHEEELWKDFVRNKNIPKCERYLTEYADGKYKTEAEFHQSNNITINTGASISIHANLLLIEMPQDAVRNIPYPALTK